VLQELYHASILSYNIRVAELEAINSILKPHGFELATSSPGYGMSPGLCIFSRIPILENQVKGFKHQDKRALRIIAGVAQKGYQVCDLRWGSNILRFVNVHLGFQKSVKKMHLKETRYLANVAISKLAKGTKRPPQMVVVCGDFNRNLKNLDPSFTSFSPFFATHMSGAILDHVFIHSNPSSALRPCDRAQVVKWKLPQHFEKLPKFGRRVSDHNGLIFEIESTN